MLLFLNRLLNQTLYLLKMCLFNPLLNYHKSASKLLVCFLAFSYFLGKRASAVKLQRPNPILPTPQNVTNSNTNASSSPSSTPEKIVQTTPVLSTALSVPAENSEQSVHMESLPEAKENSETAPVVSTATDTIKEESGIENYPGDEEIEKALFS